MSSPGIGLQHLAMRTMMSLMPSTAIPSSPERACGSSASSAGFRGSASAEGEVSLTTPEACSTLLATVLTGTLPEPMAAYRSSGFSKPISLQICANTLVVKIFWPATPSRRKASCRRSRPECSESSRCSRRKCWRIFCRARGVLTMSSQSRDGPRLDLLVMTSTMSPELSLVCKRDDAAVDLGADRVTADICVHGVGEVDGRAPRGEALDIALGGEHEDLVLEEVDAQRVHELGRVAGLGLPLHHLVQPGELVLVALAPLLVQPVRGDAVLGGHGACRGCGSGSRAACRRGRPRWCAGTGRG